MLPANKQASVSKYPQRKITDMVVLTVILYYVCRTVNFFLTVLSALCMLVGN